MGYSKTALSLWDSPLQFNDNGILPIEKEYIITYPHRKAGSCHFSAFWTIMDYCMHSGEFWNVKQGKTVKIGYEAWSISKGIK